jgi:hypothetical protein
VRSGVAPRRIQSGNTCVIQRRWAKPPFEHQTWIEFAQTPRSAAPGPRSSSRSKSTTARLTITAVRALAYKWMRIIHACWEKGEVYDEARYLKALAQHHSRYGPKSGPAKNQTTGECSPEESCKKLLFPIPLPSIPLPIIRRLRARPRSNPGFGGGWPRCDFASTRARDLGKHGA